MSQLKNNSKLKWLQQPRLSGLSLGKRDFILACLGMLSACMLRRKKNEKDILPTGTDSGTPADQGSSVAEETILVPATEDSNIDTDLGSERPIADPSLIFQNNKGLCFIKINTVDLETFEDAKEHFQAEIKLYGTSHSALIAIGFPKYQHRTFSELYLTDSSGLILARTQVTKSGDELENETLKPIYFDHIYLGSTQKFALLIRENGEKLKKFIFPKVSDFEIDFNGKQVYGLSPVSAPNEDYRRFFVDSTFRPQASQFKYKRDLNEKIDANRETLYEKGSLPARSIVTDLMGNVITSTPSIFEDLSSYSAFVVYQPSAEGSYYRSLVKIV